MNFGYVKVGCATPQLKVADVEYNTNEILTLIDNGNERGIELLVFPELSLSGATCGDLFYSSVLIDGCKKALKKIADYTAEMKMLVFVGLPLKNGNLLYNVSAVINMGRVIAFIPKSVISNNTELSDGRYFAKPQSRVSYINFYEDVIPFGTDILFKDFTNESFSVGAEIGTDIFSPLSPSLFHAVNGANIICGLSAISHIVGREKYTLNTIVQKSLTSVCGYVYAEAGKGESTSDMVFGGHNIISENGKLLKESKVFSVGIIESEIDVSFIEYERSRAFNNSVVTDREYMVINFDGNRDTENITRTYKKTPFVPCEKEISDRGGEILSIQAEGLAKRLVHAHSSTCVLGLSGGLDSTLAILVAVTAMKKLNRPLKDVVAVTMPCFGTTSRTYENTIKLSKALGVTLKKVDIGKCVARHLKDIKHPENTFDVTYENAQARERTQVLMDIANMNNGLVVGTGDLSEVALGWSTYNGDHMSMYGVNCTVPKTLVRYVVKYYADSCKGKLKAVLLDILDTPVSPELLPVENDSITQKTEDIVGPYILHDFFLYNLLRRGFSPEKMYFVAKNTFKGDFKEETILKWLKIFIRRFFIQQFKRSCTPDGVKVGTVALSPRGAWKMPSDAVSKLWIDQLENL